MNKLEEMSKLVEENRDLIAKVLENQRIIYEFLGIDEDSSVDETLSSANEDEERIQDLEELVTSIIHRLGISANLKGYKYLRTAIIMAVEDSDVLNYITKVLYPLIAKEYMTTPSRVERAMRHAIETGWFRAEDDFVNEIFGYTISLSKEKPTNSEFIAMISDKIRIEQKKQ